MFQSIKVITAFECVRDLVPKVWTNKKQSVLIAYSFKKDILIFENSFLIEYFSL